MPSGLSLTIFLCTERTIWRPKSVLIKRAAKTIMLHNYDVENCEDSRQLWWRKEKSRRKDERIAKPERQIMLATRIIHINQYFYTLLTQKSSCIAKMDAFRSSTSRRFYSSMSQALCSVPASKTPVTNIYH